MAIEFLKLAQPRVLVAQGVEAWDWIATETETLDGRTHPPCVLSKYYQQTPVGMAGYRVALKRCPSVTFWLFPVFHLTGDEHFRDRTTWFEALVPRYRVELHHMWDSVDPAE